jgi:chromate transporter
MATAASDADTAGTAGESTAAKAPSLFDIFKVFFVIGITAFGGGASAHIHHAVVHRRGWLDDKRMLEGMTLARIIPGTNVSNLAAFVGSALAGYRGAAVAICGVVLPGVFAILALAIGYAGFAEHSARIQTGLHGLTAGAVGIMASLVVNAAKPVLKSPARLLFAALAFVGVGVLQVNMLLVLLVLMPFASWVGHKEGKS